MTYLEDMLRLKDAEVIALKNKIEELTMKIGALEKQIIEQYENE